MDKHKEILQYNVEWVRFAETKATLIITALGVLITILYSSANEVYNAVNNSKLQLCFAIFSALVYLTTLALSFLVINPNLKNNNTDSVYYFGTIKNYKTYEEFNIKLNTMTEEEYKNQMSEQIYTNSKIAWNKYINVGYAIRSFSLLILVLFLQILSYIFI